LDIPISTVRAAEDYWDHHASEERKALLQKQLTALQAAGIEQMELEQAYVAQYVAEGPKYWYDATYDASHLWQGMPINMNVIKMFRDFFANGYELRWDPEQLKAPVLVVMGRYDYAVPHTLWDKVRPKFRNLTRHVFEHSGHTPQLEEPEYFNHVFLEWLSRSH
jgi:proline iminopeptidase